MKTYKNILITLLVLECLCALTFGNATINDLSVLAFFMFITSYFLYFYKESYEYFTQYQPSRYDSESRISKQSENEPEQTKSQLNMKRFMAYLFGTRIRHLDLGSREYKTQYWYKGKYY